MTGLTNTTYMLQHHKLKAEWFSASGGAFIMLKPAEQWALLGYYEFTKQLSDSVLLVHRAAVCKTQSSLPQTAGKAFAKLATFTERLEVYRVAPYPSIRKKGAPYKVHVLSQVNPDIDPKVMTKILIEIVRERAREDRAS
jgi:hypothetical protein